LEPEKSSQFSSGNFLTTSALNVISVSAQSMTRNTTVKEDGSWERTWEGTFKLTGGTGKFKNIKGGGTYRGKATAEGASTEFEGEVEY
jgi:hypothetical protein